MSDYGGEPVSVAIYAGAVAALGATHVGLVALLTRRPWLCGRVAPDEEFAHHIRDLSATVVVFLVSIPLTLVLGAAWPGAGSCSSHSRCSWGGAPESPLTLTPPRPARPRPRSRRNAPSRPGRRRCARRP
ncbi:hypothetical protein SGLAM104S_03070 [Streptomyces glaucescens]